MTVENNQVVDGQVDGQIVTASDLAAFEMVNPLIKSALDDGVIALGFLNHVRSVAARLYRGGLLGKAATTSLVNAAYQATGVILNYHESE